MYYRVAIYVEPSPQWQWKSSALSSLEALFQWLRLYRALPHDRLRIFSCTSRGEMERGAVTQRIQGNEQTTYSTVVTEASLGEGSTELQTLGERGINSLEKRRGDLERGIGGDRDLLYRFTLPTAMPQVPAWVKLLVRVHNGDLQL